MRYNFRMVTLAEISDDLSDGLHKAPEFVINGEYLFVNATNLENGYIVEKDKGKRTTYEEYCQYGVPLTERTILYSIDGTIGNIARYRGEKCVLGKGACYITVSSDVDVDYIYYQLQTPHFKSYIRSMSTGSTIKHISLKTMRNYSFPLPELEVQRTISSILYTLDDKIKLNQRINENLERQAQALYTAMFVDNIELPTTPGILSDIATITMGQSPNGNSYNENGVGEVFYQGRAEFGFRFPTRRLFTTEPKRIAQQGDILLSVRAPVGDLNVAYEQCCIGRGLGAIHSKNGNESFLLYTMFALKPQLDVFNGEGTVFGSINRNALNAMPIKIPAADKIVQFENLVYPIDNLIRTNYEEICRLKTLRNSLLPKLMAGEIEI
ncbi:hypothetical protein N510_001435 [Firmicutes bacterium ASF500]|nr:hypothetical protein N510_001435 [Firmicutes bacterium ASF500]